MGETPQDSSSKLYIPFSPAEAHEVLGNLSRVHERTRFAVSEQTSLDKRMRSLLKQSSPHEYERSDYSDVRSFFDEASKDYDSDIRNPYWAFSHEILRHILRKFISDHFQGKTDIRLFDAGAGTGNWSNFVLSMNEKIQGTLFDMNPNMLKIAYGKMSNLNGNVVKMAEGNLETPGDYPRQKANLALCMHNVIGLGRNTDLMLRNLCAHLEDDSLAFVMAPNKYHAFNFTRKFRDEIEALRVLQDGTVKFKDDMPEMFCYTPQEFQEVLQRAGFNEVTVLGFPVTIYPTVRDTKLCRETTTEEHLKDQKIRSALLEVEKRLCLDPQLAYRAGSSLIGICKKSVAVPQPLGTLIV